MPTAIQSFPVFLKIFASGVDLFFIVSGFVIVAVTRGKISAFRRNDAVLV